MDWIISESDQLSPPDADRLGNKLLTGNGYLGYRGTLEEYSKEQKTATIVSGLYDKVGEQWREPVNLPNGGFVQIVYQGEPLHALTSKVIEHSQGIDMRQAVHERRTTFLTPDGIHLTVHSRRFVSLASRQLICLEYTVSADRECVVDIRTGIDGDVWDINGPHLRELHTHEQEGVISLTAVTHENALPLAVSEMVVFQEGNAIPAVGISPQPGRNEKIFREIRSVRINEEITFHKFIAHCVAGAAFPSGDLPAADSESLSVADVEALSETQPTPGLEASTPLEASRDFCRQAAAVGFEALLAEHSALWAQRWADCDIQIEGDASAQQALRFSMYHLLAIAPTYAATVSIPARGLSGQIYKGAIFWDTEIFMLPFFTHAFPALARNLLLYRYHTLAGARRKAQEYGYRGAFYAWESQDSGDDACTLFNITDVLTNRPLRTYFRDKQVHISADVAYAFWQYYTLTGDASIWYEGGAEVVFECARFFLTYTYFNLDKNRYEILDVTGPDEYHERVHNNAFTNRMVAHTLTVCLEVADFLRASSPEFLQGLVVKLDFAADLERIAQVFQDLFRPDTVAVGVVIPQFDGYFSLADVPLPDLLARKLHPNEYLGGGNGLATTTQIVKQADVVLALFLFGDSVPLETKTANWEYYEPRTEHGSSLSACSYSLIAAQIGKVDWAYRYFMQTASIDLMDKGKQYVGSLYIGGTHPAANGGAWMSAVFGLCGIRCSQDTITFDPHLPVHWTQVSLPVTFRGQRLRITLTHTLVTVEPVEPITTPLFVTVCGSKNPLPGFGKLALRLRFEQNN